jgi:SRSO17 transposase
VSALSPGTKANCWSIAEAAGHEGWHRMQALLGSYRWDWQELRGELPALAAAWLPCDPGDLIGPGIAIDETAQLKHGDATACVAPQHAGCTGKVENCVTTVFSAYVTTSGQAWADFNVYMPERWAADMQRRRAAGIPDDLAMATKPELATAQVRRLLNTGLPIRWAAFDEVYARSGNLRRACEDAGLAYAGIIPCDFSITTPAGTVIRADEAVRPPGPAGRGTVSSSPAPCRATTGDRMDRIRACSRTEKRTPKRSLPDRMPPVNDHRDGHEGPVPEPGPCRIATQRVWCSIAACRSCCDALHLGSPAAEPRET